MIPYGHHDISKEDIEAVIEVLRSDWLTQGPAVDRFESAVKHYAGAQHAVSVSSGTAALHLACRALDVGPGDYVWTSPNTFVASANCARYCGAEVDFVDIDPRTYNLDIRALEEKLAEHEVKGNLPKALVAVHFAGQSCDMAAIANLARRYGFKVIEDASHALGGTYKNTRIGSCRFSDLTVFSFHPVKIVTTGEGGMVLSNDDLLYQRLKQLRSHGITRDPAIMKDSSPGLWYYEQIDLGYNYRMTDIQCALGISQLNRIEEFLSRRQRLAESYAQLLADLPVTLPWQSPDSASAWHLHVIRLQQASDSRPREHVFQAMRDAGIGVNVHYIPVHTQPYYRDLGFKRGDFPEAERYYGEAMTLPLYPGLTDADLDRVVTALKRCLR